MLINTFFILIKNTVDIFGVLSNTIVWNSPFVVLLICLVFENALNSFGIIKVNENVDLSS
jgi:hypothetical protein